jgi:hypothetical protein
VIYERLGRRRSRGGEENRILLGLDTRALGTQHMTLPKLAQPLVYNTPLLVSFLHSQPIG